MFEAVLHICVGARCLLEVRDAIVCLVSLSTLLMVPQWFC
jgi:hypothetical protein